MNSHTRRPITRQSGMTLIELVIVLSIMSIVAALGIPHLDLSTYRADAAAQQIRSVIQTAQRTSLTRQYDVIVSIDTARGGLRIAEDFNNNGTIEITEWKLWRSIGEGNHFQLPPATLSGSAPTYSLVGGFTTISGLPSVVFHRDGSASTDAELYIASTARRRVDYRAISLTRSTGRAEVFRLGGTGASATWRVLNR